MEKIAGGGFEAKWREIAPVVERSLARRGVPRWLRDDVMQETALRLYRFWDTVDPERSPLGLAMTIATNALWDERNRRSSCEIPGAVPDRPLHLDVEDAGLARLELRRVRDALGRLSPSYRSVLLAEVGCGEVPNGNSDATKMLRLRARKKMRSLLDAASASGFVFGGQRVLGRAFGAARRTLAPTAASAAVAAACGLIAILGVPSAPPLVEADRLLITAPGPGLAHVSKAASAPDSESSEPLATRSSTQAPGQPRGTEPAEAAGAYWQVGLGDDESPVQGEAVVQISDDPTGGDVRPPSCSVERPSDDVVEAQCTADTGEQEVNASAEVQLRP